MDLRSVFKDYAGCVIGIATRSTDDGTESIGTAFHIGDGFFLTARHVVEDRTISDIVFHSYVAAFTTVYSAHFPADPSVDLALLSTDFDNGYEPTAAGTSPAMEPAIRLGGHLSDWLDDGLVLMPVVLMGFPPVPTTRGPVLVAVTGEVNAVVDTYTAADPHFIVSPTARGGFSGGPVITDGGWLLGVMTESLTREPEHREPGFSAALTVEPIFGLLTQLRLAPRANRAICFLLGYESGWPPTGVPDESDELFNELLTSEELKAFQQWRDDFVNREEPTQLGKACAPLLQAEPLWVATPGDRLR